MSRGSIVGWGSYYNFSGSWSWVHGVSRFFYDCVETVVVISGIVNSSESTIGFSYSVRSLDYVTIANFVLSFVVTGMRILNSIVVFVFWFCVIVLVFVCWSVSMRIGWGYVFGDDWSGV
ncbi:unnamed protein product [Ceutorhynchus assimilis]|uniref:Uncharacterized protein n=1 Tax=Ceutorhynchus assimilis TaxID=467358 RepID=A0A9N9MVK8_9CUCU|nr:unnamed protein product [Ceutorhynchus assimilis]